MDETKFEFLDTDDIALDLEEVSADEDQGQEEQQEEQHDDIDNNIEPNDPVVEDGKEDNDEDTNDDDDSASSNPYSSIAKDLSEHGILSSFEDGKINTPEELLEAINKSVEDKLDERQKRIEEALNNGVEPDEIKGYENAINYLDSIEEDLLSEESEDAMDLRKRLITQDLMNRGYNQARIEREVKKSIDTGNDIDDAIEALKANKEYFAKGYEAVIEQKRIAKEAHDLNVLKQAKEIQDAILKTETVFDGIAVDQVTRKKAFDNIYKPTYTDPNTGEKLTAIQKYERDNKKDFMHNLAIIFTLTDEFKNLDKLVGLKVNKNTKSAMSALERAINNTSRKNDGNIDFMSGMDNESYSGLELDI